MRSLVLLSLVAACGTAPQGDLPQQENSGQENEPKATDKTDLGDNPEAYKTLYVAKASDMGECNASKKSWLIYVKDEKKFYNCDNGWEAVEVVTEKIIEKTIEPSYDADFGNMVKDVRTGLTWALGAYTFRHEIDFNVCGEGYRLPTEEEANEGTNAGLAVYMAEKGLTPHNFWTMDNETDLKKFVYTMHRSYNANITDVAYLVCVVQD